MRPAGFLRVLSCRLAFFRQKNQHYRGFDTNNGKSLVFYRALCAPPRAARLRRPLSRIRPGRALRHGKGATRRKRRRQNTVLSERRVRRSRARGWVDFRNCQHYRGSGVPGRGSRGNLRHICILGFWICQHYRRCGSSDSRLHGNYRHQFLNLPTLSEMRNVGSRIAR